MGRDPPLNQKYLTLLIWVILPVVWILGSSVSLITTESQGNKPTVESDSLTAQVWGPYQPRDIAMRSSKPYKFKCLACHSLDYVR